MRIISKTHDFYDGVQRMGQDQTLLYVRNSKTLPISWTFPRIYTVNGLDDVECNCYMIGFCGSVYPLLRLRHRPRYVAAGPFYLCYDAEQVLNFVTYQLPRDNRRGEDRYFQKKPYTDSSFCHKNVERFFGFKGDQVTAKLFTDNRCPVWIITLFHHLKPAVLELNPTLKEFEFMRMFDSFAAYQQIMMWMSNQARPEPPIPQPSDEIKIEQHGLDPKWSFRKEPTKKKVSV